MTNRSQHNLHHLLKLLQKVRESIQKSDLDAFVKEVGKWFV